MKRAKDPEWSHETLRYLMDGGLGEMMGFVAMAKDQKCEKVQMDTDHAATLLMLAHEALRWRVLSRTRLLP